MTPEQEGAGERMGLIDRLLGLHTDANDCVDAADLIRDDYAEITALRSQVADLRAGQANDDRDYRALMERAERAEADRHDWHLHYTQAMQSLHKAEVERDALKQDAERYRWLRDECDTTTGFLLAQRLEADEWDAAIDADRTKENSRDAE